MADGVSAAGFLVVPAAFLLEVGQRNYCRRKFHLYIYCIVLCTCKYMGYVERGEGGKFWQQETFPCFQKYPSELLREVVEFFVQHWH